MKTSLELSNETWKHQKDDAVTIPHRTAFELLKLITELYETHPGKFDELGNHPIQPPTWISILAKAIEE